MPPTSAPHPVSAPGLPPVLVVSTTDDPATPYQAGDDLAKELGGALLTKELLREANTVGSKVQDVELSAAVVELKGELERFREQIQNVE